MEEEYKNIMRAIATAKSNMLSMEDVSKLLKVHIIEAKYFARKLEKTGNVYVAIGFLRLTETGEEYVIKNGLLPPYTV